ncbi:MAG: phosphate/phosphite/phosphonate ABC transporter substrate-binding protein [Pseudomonadota bacterium]
MRTKTIIFLALICILFTTTSCDLRREALGSEKNPIVFYFLPLKGAEAFNNNAPLFEKFIKEKAGLVIKAVEAPDFIATIKALGKKKADIAFMNTLGYLLAHDWAKAEAHLIPLYGDVYSSYRGEIIVRADSKIDKLSDLGGKTIAFADPYSTGGYLYPLKLLHEHNVKPAKTVFAGGHKKAVEMLYDKEVDAAAVYHTKPSDEGFARDARMEIADLHPDVISKIKILALTDEIPNGPVATRYDLPDDVRVKLIGALMEFARTPEGRKALLDLYNITGLAIARDAEYDSVRKTLKELNKTTQEVVPGGISFYRTWIVPGLE